jgi:hypothetical protein
LQVPKDKDDDYPTMLKYLMNESPSFSVLAGSGKRYEHPGKRRGAY